MRLRFLHAAIAATAALALSSTSALASDAKTFSSSACRPLNAAQTDLQYKVVGLTNNNAATRTVICTLTRDEQSGIDDAAQTLIAPWYKIGATPGFFTCTAYHGSITTPAIESATASSGTLAANSQGFVALYLDETPGGWSQVQINLVCQFSQNVTLAHIYTNEAGATD